MLLVLGFQVAVLEAQVQPVQASQALVQQVQASQALARKVRELQVQV